MTRYSKQKGSDGLVYYIESRVYYSEMLHDSRYLRSVFQKKVFFEEYFRIRIAVKS